LISGPTVESFTPLSGSPVLKNTLTIVGSGFGTVLTDLTVKLIKNTGNREINCFVTAVTDIEILCNVPGGSVGVYTP
jgi:hypothetical protein